MTLTKDIQTEVFVDSSVDGPGWQDITSRVRYAQAIEIAHGSRGISEGIPEPSECRMTLDCRDGLLWPANPMSEFYPSLGLNTPLRVVLGLVDHTFPGTVVDDWSDVGGYPVVNTGLGGTVAASDWQQTPGVATHSIPTTSAYRQSVLDGWDMEDCEQQLDFRLPTANVAGGAIEPANLIFRDTGTERWLVRVVVNTDETISVKWLLIRDGIGEFDLTATIATSITNTGQWITVKGNVEAGRAQTKVWVAGGLEPLEWDNNQDGEIPIAELNTGSIGVRTGVASGNSNTKPIVVEYRNWIVRSIRFHGEISQFPMETDTSGNEIRVPIVAAGETRRLKQGTPPTLSALARAIPQLPGMQAYWSLEAERGSTNFGSSIAGHPPMIPLTGTPGYAEYSDLVSSQSLPTGNGSDWRGAVPDYTDTGNLQISFVLNLPTGGQPDRSILCRWYTEHPSAKLWQVIYRTGGDLQLQAWNSESAFVYEATAANVNLDAAGPQLISIQLIDNGSDVDWEMRALGTTGGSSLDTGTATGVQLASCKSVWMNLQLLDTPAYGHVFVQSVLTDVFELIDEFRAWPFLDFPTHRIDRLLSENGYEFTPIWDNEIPNFEMGFQRPGTTPALLEECITLDSGGMWFDGRSHAGILYTERPALYNQPAWVTLSLAGKQIQPSWRPVIGDRDIRNRVTVSRVDGSKATFELETGPNSIQKRPDGVGPYGTQVTVNADSDEFLQQIAAFRVALGTIDAPIYPAAAVELAAPAVLADPAIENRLLDLRPGRVFEVTDAEAVYQFGPARLVCVGYTERLSPVLHSFELIGEPAGPYTVFELEDPLLGVLDSGSSTLTGDISDSATTFEVTSTEELWTTDPAWFPLDILVGGERMVCTDINATVPAYIATGAASHADNTSCTPGVPGGATGAGDDMLMITRGRAQAANDPGGWSGGTGTGWTVVVTAGAFKMFRKTHTGSESAPTVTWPAGAAGDVNSAVTTSWTDLGDLITSIGTNVGGVQNIPILGLTGYIADGVAITAGAKSDDWTSVATRSSVGATEIVETSTTIGNDQGLVVDYITHNGSATGLPSMTTPPSEFVVTGGAPATIRSLVMIFGNPQTFVVTRSADQVVKPHKAGTQVHCSYEPRYAL